MARCFFNSSDFGCKTFSQPNTRDDCYAKLAIHSTKEKPSSTHAIAIKKVESVIKASGYNFRFTLDLVAAKK